MGIAGQIGRERKKKNEKNTDQFGTDGDLHYGGYVPFRM
jgi:hypothetical protein